MTIQQTLPCSMAKMLLQDLISEHLICDRPQVSFSVNAPCGDLTSYFPHNVLGHSVPMSVAFKPSREREDKNKYDGHFKGMDTSRRTIKKRRRRRITHSNKEESMPQTNSNRSMCWRYKSQQNSSHLFAKLSSLLTVICQPH